MNEKVIRHKAICDGLNELYARKNHDYGDSFHKTFLEEGMAMPRIRLEDKLSRFKTLSRISPTDSTQQQVTDESIIDTLLDLANYAIMTVLELKEAGFIAERDKVETYRASIISLYLNRVPAEVIGHRLGLTTADVEAVIASIKSGVIEHNV